MGVVIIFQFEVVVSKGCALNPLMKTSLRKHPFHVPRGEERGETDVFAG